MAHLPVLDFMGAATPHGAYLSAFFLAFVAMVAPMRVLIGMLSYRTGGVGLAQLMHASLTGSRMRTACLARVMRVAIQPRVGVGTRFTGKRAGLEIDPRRPPLLGKSPSDNPGPSMLLCTQARDRSVGVVSVGKI